MNLNRSTELRLATGASQEINSGIGSGIASRACAACGSVGYPGDRYCACCGTQLLRLCRGCNAPVLQPVANYCTHCGATLGRAHGTK